MAFGTLDVKLHPPSGTIVLRRRERRNALSRRSVADLEQAFSDLHQQKNVRAVILAAEGDVFCSGSDLVELSKTQQEEDPFVIYREDVAAMQGLLETILERQEEGMDTAIVPYELRRVARWVRSFSSGEVMARLPFDLQVR